MENKKVYLSFGRHGRYGRDTPIERLSMLEAYLSGELLVEKYPSCDKLYYSPIARAEQTAKFRALGLKCPHMIEVQQLSEDSPTFEIRKFVNTLISYCKEEKHLHFVTHLPVIEKLGLGIIGCGEIVICAAENWQEMLCDNFEIKILPVPSIEESAKLLQKMGIAAVDFNNLSAQNILKLLLKL